MRKEKEKQPQRLNTKNCQVTQSGNNRNKYQKRNRKYIKRNGNAVHYPLTFL